MKVFIKGKGFTDWKEDIEEDNKDDIFTVARYYIDKGYDVKIEQN